ncbi:MAG: hypothetical protein Q8K02_08115 [Flavobacterium sp.]|nr:hypothetical protein [Flavobacterium sp.]
MIKFKPGQIVATPGAINAMNANNVNAETLLARHLSGDWGDLCKEDKELNDEALQTGEDRFFSSYNITPDIKIWIITEWNRSVTTFLLPEEY